MRRAIVLTFVAMTACGGSSAASMDEILRLPAVQAAITESNGRNNMERDGRRWLANTCGGFALRESSAIEGASADAPAVAASVPGTYVITSADNDCMIFEDSNGPRMDGCGLEITFDARDGEELTQKNMGGVSMGSGSVAFVRGGDRYAVIAQHNEAVGASCRQEVVNLIVLDTAPEQPPTPMNILPRGRDCNLTVILESTCGGPRWLTASANWRRS